MVNAVKKQSSGVDYEAIFDQRVAEAKKLPPCDIKLILCGDSAVGKSK
jgi:GTPase SAR1 family protein